MAVIDSVSKKGKIINVYVDYFGTDKAKEAEVRRVVKSIPQWAVLYYAGKYRYNFQSVITFIFKDNDFRIE